MRNTHLLGSLPIIASAVAAQDGILSFPIRATSVVGNLGKRQLEADAQSRQDGTIYTIDVSIGTPGEVVSLEIDTGSEEMWVNPICSEATYPALCAEAGRYSQSSTRYDVAVDSSRLADDGYVGFSYVYDTVSIGSTRIAEQIFGVATDSERFSVGQLGLGPSPAGWESEYGYPYVLDKLVASQAISSKAFSLDLGRDGNEDGALIFGGIDTSRYVGSLERISVVSASDAPDGFTRYWITSSRVGVTRDNSIALISNTPIIFHVNSGSPISALPTTAFNDLISAFSEATPAAQLPGRYTVPCTLADVTGSIDFSFGSTVINVPLADFIWRQPEGCYLGAYSSEIPVLGANFLRAAYVVFDWDNREVHVANSARETCTSNLVAIGSGPDAVPAVVGSCESSTSSTMSSTVSSTASSTSATSTSATSTSSSSTSVSVSSTSTSISSTLSTSTLSSSTFSSASASSTLTTSTLSSSTLSSSTIVSSTLSTSALSSSTESSYTDTSSAAASSTQASSTESASSESPATDSSTDISSTAAPASASTTTSVSSSVSSESTSTFSDPDRLSGRDTIHPSPTANLESSTASSHISTISSLATSSVYYGNSTASLNGTVYPSDSTVTSSATSSVDYVVSIATLDSSTVMSSALPSTYYGDRTAVPTYVDKVCEAETPISTSSTASPTYGATSSQSTLEVYDPETISSTSSVASPTYAAESSTSEAASSSKEAYSVETESFTSVTASPTHGAESSSSATTSSSVSNEVPYGEKTGYLTSLTASPTHDLGYSSSATSSSSITTEAPYEEKTDAVYSSTASPTYGAESSSSETTSSSVTTDEPYGERTGHLTSSTASPTYSVESSSSETTSSSVSTEETYGDKTGHLTSLTASPTYGSESSSSETSSSSESTEAPYEEKTVSSSAVYISSTHVPTYGEKDPYSAVPSKEPLKSDDYRDISTITTVITTVTSAPHYDTVTSATLDETITITITDTTTSTITACSKYDAYCSVGGVTTEIVTHVTTVCPEKTLATTSTDLTSSASTPTASTSDVSDYEERQSTSAKTSSLVTVVTSKTCTESAVYPTPTTSGPYNGMGHRGYGSGPQDDVYHEEEARDEYGSHSGPIYNHDEFAYQDKPSSKEAHYQPSPASTSSTQTPSPTEDDNTPAYSSIVTSSASASPVYTEPAYEHVTAGASAGGVPVLLILCVGILTVLLMQ